MGREHAVGGRQHRHRADPRPDRERRRRDVAPPTSPATRPRTPAATAFTSMTPTGVSQPPPRDAVGRRASRAPPRTTASSFTSSRSCRSAPGTSARFYELTVRLREDGGALVPPTEFIPAAERYNVMSAIDRWVVDARRRAAAPAPAARRAAAAARGQPVGHLPQRAVVRRLRAAERRRAGGGRARCASRSPRLPRSRACRTPAIS